jgi:uncharacterized protein involved in outer membrane biogenesis
MKIIKSQIATSIISCFILLNVQLASAQNTTQNLKNKTPEQRAQLQTAMMKTKLKLDTTQVIKVQDINLKYAQKLDPVIKGDCGKLAKFRQLKSIQKEKEKELKPVFTADQYKQYQQMQEEMKEKLKDYRSQN